jgi:hypothetical protein
MTERISPANCEIIFVEISENSVQLNSNPIVLMRFPDDTPFVMVRIGYTEGLWAHFGIGLNGTLSRAGQQKLASN